MDDKDEGALLLLDVVRSSRKTQRSPHWCWELIVELTVSMLSPPNAGAMTGENLSHSMVLLFRNQPNTTQEFKSWMERWIQECKRAHQSRPNGSASEHMEQPNTWITVRLSPARSAYRVSCRAPFFSGRFRSTAKSEEPAHPSVSGSNWFRASFPYLYPAFYDLKHSCAPASYFNSTVPSTPSVSSPRSVGTEFFGRRFYTIVR